MAFGTFSSESNEIVPYEKQYREAIDKFIQVFFNPEGELPNRDELYNGYKKILHPSLLERLETGCVNMSNSGDYLEFNLKNNSCSIGGEVFSLDVIDSLVKIELLDGWKYKVDVYAAEARSVSDVGKRVKSRIEQVRDLIRSIRDIGAIGSGLVVTKIGQAMSIGANSGADSKNDLTFDNRKEKYINVLTSIEDLIFRGNDEVDEDKNEMNSTLSDRNSLKFFYNVIDINEELRNKLSTVFPFRGNEVLEDVMILNDDGCDVLGTHFSEEDLGTLIFMLETIRGKI